MHLSMLSRWRGRPGKGGGFELRSSFQFKCPTAGKLTMVKRVQILRPRNISVWSDIWNISYITSHSFLSGSLEILKWPVPNVSGFIAQLVGALHLYREVTGSNHVEILTFSGFYTQLSFGLAMGILARLPLAKIRTMARPNSPDMPPKRTKKVLLGI